MHSYSLGQEERMWISKIKESRRLFSIHSSWNSSLTICDPNFPSSSNSNLKFYTHHRLWLTELFALLKILFHAIYFWQDLSTNYILNTFPHQPDPSLWSKSIRTEHPIFQKAILCQYQYFEIALFDFDIGCMPVWKASWCVSFILNMKRISCRLKAPESASLFQNLHLHIQISRNFKLSYLHYVCSQPAD